MEQNIEKIIEEIKIRQQELQPRESTKQTLLKSFGTAEKSSTGQYWYVAAAISIVALACFWLYTKPTVTNSIQDEMTTKYTIKPAKIEQNEQVETKKLAQIITKKPSDERKKVIGKHVNQKIKTFQNEKPIDIQNVDDADIVATFYRKNPNMTWEIETEDTLAKAQKIFWDIEK